MKGVLEDISSIADFLFLIFFKGFFKVLPAFSRLAAFSEQTVRRPHLL